MTLPDVRRAVGIALVVALLSPPAPAPALDGLPLEGFGATTRGGADGVIIRVTNLNDSGPGSLRAAAAGGGRTIVFDVAGEIALSDYIRVRGRGVTIDGFTAPTPGITLRGHGVAIEGSAGAHEVIVRGLRVRGAVKDGIRVAYGASSVVIDHVSVHGSGDGNLDISESRDVTVSWSILAEPAAEEKNMLIKYAPARVTLHHNLFVEARQRNPQVRIDDAGTRATETTLDMRNNVVWRWPGGYGTLVWHGPRANVVNNYFASPGSSSAEQAQALSVRADTGALAYVAGNVSGDGVTGLNTRGTEGAPFDAPLLTTTSACDAAHAVVAGAGMRPLDAVDARYVDAVTLPGCAGSTPAPAPTPPPAMPDLVVSSFGMPGTATAGASINADVRISNPGTGKAVASTTRIYLSADGSVGAGDAVLGTIDTPELPAGSDWTTSRSMTLPAGTAPATYRFIARADDAGAVTESSEINNTVSTTVVVGASGTGSGGSDLAMTQISGPGSVRLGASFSATSKVKNRGTQPSPATTVTLYLSRDPESVAGATALGTRTVSALAPGATSTGTTTLTVPPGTTPGSYYLVAVADAAGAISETSESNNLRGRSLDVD